MAGFHRRSSIISADAPGGHDRGLRRIRLADRQSIASIARFSVLMRPLPRGVA
jgi:hypothetical protein